ncbi:MAG TPA: 23S rRNA (adenine(2503)-C(2))-methyltransferase RlmN [candidate division WOR-3 bacterium]|uniref:Probable dual-specificity RNA methyltransferase RlmN n=1 Tax=candidate division WOR-3 bacterium TaxID=2052148 RepID=A0A7V0XF39_UNCW3|nr:23S rRNA (adenine(2503)-C(2))-methyltransferase RlmN [candidate division WOR-3 bacterium]
MKPDIRSLTRADLADLCREFGWEQYRGRQLYTWLWQKQVTGFAAMTNISIARREELARRFRLFIPETIARREGPDGTARFTFRLEDGAVVESVYIPDRDRRTACLSTQVGCALGCRFCRTARLGFTRDLGWHEIAGQALEVARVVPDRLTNIVLMGMGEPLANYEATVTAVAELNAPAGLNIGARRITVSTAGLPAAIRRFARFPLQVRLAVSLNAADDETRDRLMPVNRRHPLASVIAAVREFIEVRNKRVTFEYVLLRGINDRDEDARRLAALLRGLSCKVNLILFNPFPGAEGAGAQGETFAPPEPATAERFAQLLYPLLPAVTIRRSRGGEIGGACGQLAADADSC